MAKVLLKPNKTNNGHSVFIVSTTGRFKPIYVDFKLLFELVRAFAVNEEFKRGVRLVKESAGFDGAKRIAKLAQYAAGRRFSWRRVCKYLDIPFQQEK